MELFLQATVRSLKSEFQMKTDRDHNSIFGQEYVTGSRTGVMRNLPHAPADYTALKESS